MFDWLRYLPIQLRKDQRQTNLARRAYCQGLIPTVITMGDNKLTIKLARSYRMWQPFDFGFEKKPRCILPYNRDVLTTIIPNSFSGTVSEGGRWGYSTFLLRQWYFLSPWFGGVQIPVRMNATVITAPQEKKFETISFFHPRAFESALAEYLDSRYGTQKLNRGPEYRGPINWQPVTLNKYISGVRFDVESVTATDDSEQKHQLFAFPIAKQQFVVFTFPMHNGRSPTSEIRNSSEIEKMVEATFASIQLELGPQTIADCETVKATCPDMSLTPEFGLLKWPIKIEDVGKALPEQNKAPPLPEQDNLHLPNS